MFYFHEKYFFSAASDQPKKSQSLPKDPNVVSSQQEEDDIAKAIQLVSTFQNSSMKIFHQFHEFFLLNELIFLQSLQESKGHTSSSKTSTNTSSASLYPSASSLYGNAAAGKKYALIK